ncbi:MAG: histidinol-phosphate transaminase [Thermoleophilaceae bacterium]
MPFRDALGNVDPYRPQPPMGVLAARLGLPRMIKLASNEGAFGPLPASVGAYHAAAAGLHRYPDGGATPLREALAARHGVPFDQVVIGNGADELIRLCGAIALDPGDSAVVPWPSFPSYLSAAAVHGAGVVRVPPSEGWATDLDAVSGMRGRVVFLANPNNPTGTLLDRKRVRRFLGGLPPRVLCVLDEAYAEYADPAPEGPALVAEGRENLCVLRTFSKAYGLAALRVGYAIASPDVAAALNRVRPIFNVNQPAQEAALAALGEAAAVTERVAHVHRARERLRVALDAAGLGPVASQTNFVLAETPDGDADGLADRLLRKGFIVRALRGFGAPRAIRVTCGTDEENAAFAAILPEVVSRT